MENILLNKKKVVLGLSGGVDSTTAALLLTEKGFSVTGLYFDVLGTNKEGMEQANRSAEHMKIPFLYKDVSSEFDKIVIENFCGEYLNGRTPNPCIICNPAIKFKILLEAADQIGAYHIATGHYAGTIQEPITGNWHIKKATNEKKDQSYMLYRLGQEAISRLLLPLEDIESKSDTRRIARENSLKNADLKDSQEICFLSESQNYSDYIKKRGHAVNKGFFINSSGQPMGQHQGLVNYTVGQRKGLGITFGKPVFVTGLDPQSNTVTLGDNRDLFHSSVLIDNIFFTSTNGGTLPKALEGAWVTAKIRYAAKPAKARLKNMHGGVVEVLFEEPQRAPAPGQSLVLYDGDMVVGGGFIV